MGKGDSDAGLSTQMQTRMHGGSGWRTGEGDSDAGLVEVTRMQDWWLVTRTPDVRRQCRGILAETHAIRVPFGFRLCRQHSTPRNLHRLCQKCNTRAGRDAILQVGLLAEVGKGEGGNWMNLARLSFADAGKGCPTKHGPEDGTRNQARPKKWGRGA
jgi:hypothetical protein